MKEFEIYCNRMKGGNSIDMSKKITVAGIGGVGGYLAGMLADTYDEVSFIARGARKKSLEENGILLHSEYHGEVKAYAKNVVECGNELEVQDYIFICVKNYSLEEVCDSLKDCVGEHTILIPVMNGADPGERVRKYIGRGIVVDSLIYILSYTKDDFSVVQKGNFADIKIGISNANEREKQAVENVYRLLKEAKVDCVVAEDIEAEIWRKYIFNCAYNVLTAHYQENVGQLRLDEKKRKEFRQLLREAYEVGKAKGVHLVEEDVVRHQNRFENKLADDATSSLQRDVEAGKHNTELETFCGDIVRMGRELGVDVSLTEKFFALMN